MTTQSSKRIFSCPHCGEKLSFLERFGEHAPKHEAAFERPLNFFGAV